MRAAYLWLVFAGFSISVHAQCTGAETQLQAASAALASEDTSKADQIISVLSTAYPDCPEISLDRGRSLYLKGDLASAEEAFTSYIQLAPDDARGYASLGRLQLDQRHYPRADASSLTALAKNPAEPSALALRGQILGVKGQADKGIALLQQACELDTKNADAHYQLANLYIQLKLRTEAVAALDKSLAVAPNNASAWDYLALNLEPLGEFDRADEAYRKGDAVNVSGRHYDRFLDYNYGRFLTKRYQLKAAKEHLDKAVESAPTVRAVWYERAKVEVLLKNYPAARTDAEKAMSLEDRGGIILDLQMYTLLEQIYSKLGEAELAKKYADLSRQTAVPLQQSR